jgi:hypothetical protein
MVCAASCGRAFLGANVRDLNRQLGTLRNKSSTRSSGSFSTIVEDDEDFAELHVHLSNATNLKCKVQALYLVMCHTFNRPRVIIYML